MLWYTLQEHSCVEGFVCFLGEGGRGEGKVL